MEMDYIPLVQLFSDLHVPLPRGARQTEPMLAVVRPINIAMMGRWWGSMIGDFGLNIRV